MVSKDYNKIYADGTWIKNEDMNKLGYRKKMLISFILNEPKHINILDIGCGEGDTLAALRGIGYKNLSGIDIVETEGIQELKEHITFIKSSVESFLNGSPYFKYDIIIMADVLEHIEKDKMVLEKISEILNERGRLLICVPAFQFLWGADDELVGHYRRYSKKYMLHAIDKTPFRMVDVRYLGFPFYLIARIVNNLMIKLGYSQKTAGTVVISAAQNNKILTFLVGIAISIERVFNRIPLGTEAIFILSK